METKVLIKNLFNKEAGITYDDLKEIILGNVSENSSIEYKRIDNLNREMNRDELTNLIMHEVIAFLNKITYEGGLLVLGIYAKDKIPTEIIGVDKKIIKNVSALQSLITNNLSSIPVPLQIPDIEIESVPLDSDKTVYLIEVHPRDLNVLYFSKSSDTAHVREIDKARRLSLDECVRLIQTKKVAQLFAELESNPKIVEEFVIHTVKVVFINRGNKPATNVLTMFLFSNNDKKDKSTDMEVTFFGTKNISETTNINACLKSYQQNYNQLCYPKRPMVMANFSIKFLRTAPKRLDLEIDEENGRTSQSFIFTEEKLIRETEAFSAY